MACQAVSNIVKTSLGPVGLDKVCYSGSTCFVTVLRFIYLVSDLHYI